MSFKAEMRQEFLESAYLPEPVQKQRFLWGLTEIGQVSELFNYRFVVGDWPGVVDRIRTVAAEMDEIRWKYPEIDRLRLLQELPAVSDTGITYYDYEGVVTAHARDSVYMQGNANNISLERGATVPFRGVVVMNGRPWSQDQQIFEEVLRARWHRLSLGIGFGPKLDITEPWRVRHALATEWQNLMTTTFMMYATEALPERLEDLVSVEKLMQEWVTKNLEWLVSLTHWESQQPLPLPGPLGIKDLWSRDQYPNPNYSTLAPWMQPIKPTAASEVTLIRKADIMYGGRMSAQVTIYTEPTITTLRHPNIEAGTQIIGYARPTTPQCRWSERDKRLKPVEPLNTAGNMFRDSAVDGWQAMTSGNMPELRARLRTRIVRIDRKFADDLQSASIMRERVVLYFDQDRALNGQRAPVLVLPQSFADVQLLPVCTEATRLVPTTSFSNVEGSCIKSVNGVSHVAVPAAGFLPEPVSAGLSRSGAVSELF